MSNETKIGILAIVAIALSLWGYKFVKGKNMFSSSNLFYVEYDAVDQLQKSNPVLINGFQVGIVSDLYLKPETADAVVVELDINNEVNIPVNTIASIVSTGMMGGKAVVLEYDKPCFDNCAESGAYLRGATKGMLSSMLGDPGDVGEYMDVVKNSVGGIIDTIKVKVGDEEGELNKSLKDMQQIIENLKTTSRNLNYLMAASSKQLDGILTNMNGITDNIEGSNAEITSILKNADTFTSKLTQIELEKTLAEAEKALKNLSATMETADKAVADINAITTKINSGDGTLGKLIADEALYKQLSSASFQADSLLTDFRSRPYRYMPLKSRNRVKKHDEKDAKAKAEEASGGGQQ